jgi:hypothetical protein
MKCPKCNIALVMSERQGVEIDYCPECRGVWLDRGELDKILERSEQDQAPRGYTSPPPPPPSHYKGHYDDDYKRHGGGYYKGKKSWLHELFD